MINILKLTTIVALSSSLLLAAPSQKRDAELKSVVKIGDRGSKMLLQTLGKNMKKRLADGGVMSALDFCSNEAFTLTENVNKKLPNGVRVKRISAKYRSPANKASTKELAILASFEKMKEMNIILPKHLIEKVDNHTYKYYKPLFIKKQICLECHGDIKNIDIKRAIASRYPLDKALGYKMGDLRGAIIVTVDKSK